MLTDAKLRSLKPAGKLYKVADRDGLYAAVLVSGCISFRYNYRINGRNETLVLGRYDVGGVIVSHGVVYEIAQLRELKTGRPGRGAAGTAGTARHDRAQLRGRWR